MALSARIDPTLAAERKDARRAEQLENEQDAAASMESRDRTGKGYLRLNFFNLFWEFVVRCVLGLILEIIWHMTVVDPGVYEDRAGLLYGPRKATSVEAVDGELEEDASVTDAATTAAGATATA